MATLGASKDTLDHMKCIITIISSSSSCRPTSIRGYPGACLTDNWNCCERKTDGYFLNLEPVVDMHILHAGCLFPSCGTILVSSLDL